MSVLLHSAAGPARTFQLRIVAVVDVLVRPRTAAQEALLVRLVHVDEQLRVAVELAPAEAAAGVPREPGLRERASHVARPTMLLQLLVRVQHLLGYEHLREAQPWRPAWT